MKLESLKSSKFQTFEGFEVKNPLKVVGGQGSQVDRTTYKQYAKDSTGTYVLKHEGTDGWAYGPDATHNDMYWGVAGDMTRLTDYPIEGSYYEYARV